MIPSVNLVSQNPQLSYFRHAQSTIHRMMCDNRLVGLEDLSYTIGITDKRISITGRMGIWSCTNATASVFV
jgi:hypothetical protein